LPQSQVCILLQEVRRQFPESGLVFDRFNLEIRRGEFVTFLGPSGCGKSTLLRLIAGLDQADAGRVEFGFSADALRRGFVFQDAHLLPWRSVLENVVLPLEIMGWKRAESEAAAEEVLERVGLKDSLRLLPSQLSGGMKMRVSLARALVSRPDLLLLDEPFAALDESTRYQLQEDLRELCLQSGITVVFVTHSVSEAVFLSDRAIVLSGRPTRILLDREVDLPQTRNSQVRFSSSLMNEVALIGAAFREGIGERS
jgi:NitT/TauT family transport system ATP-binding protein